MVEKITNTKLEIISVYKHDYLTQYHIRKMAKLMKKSHVTLLPHLKALEKDKILTAKTIGKNKAYSLNFNNILTKEYILLSETVKTIAFLEKTFLIKKISAELFNLNLLGAIILFGSYAKGTAKENSDIDIFYLGKVTEKEIEGIKKAGKTYGKIINVKKSSLKTLGSGLKNKDPLLTEIVKDHIILQNPGNFVDTLWRYFNAIRR
jgi:predicted nucleotidyltransferase